MRYQIIAIVALFASNYVQANDAIVEIPFTIKNGHTFVQAKINGHDVHAALDTGAVGASGINTRVANRIGLKYGGNAQVTGVGGSGTAKQSHGNTIEINSLKLTDKFFMVMDFDHLSDEDVAVDAILGDGIFNDYVVETNYDDLVIRLYDPENFNRPSGYESVDIKLRPYGVPVIPGVISVPNEKPISGNFVIDTGDASTINLFAAFAEENDLASKFTPNFQSRFKSGATGKQIVSTYAKLEKADLLGRSIKDATIRFSGKELPMARKFGIIGSVGLEVLKRFNTFYDYKNKMMHISANHLIDTPYKINYSGLRVKKRNGMFSVEDVFAGSAAEDAQIRIGDIVKSVDRKMGMTRDQFHDYFQARKSVVVLEVVRDEKTINIDLNPRSMLRDD